MNVLIVDDEPLAVEVLEAYVLKVPGANIIGTCGDALEAFRMLNKQRADVILLDINIPEITGLDFLKMLKDPPAVILTTAYSEYAVESYNHNVVDYLLKPITFERFMKAIHKLSGFITSDTGGTKEDPDTLFVRSDGKMIKIDLPQLYIIEGYKNYVRLWTDKGKIIVHSTMKNFEEYLEQHPNFIRVHKSYIVNIAHISEVSATSINVGDQSIAVGATFREAINALMRKYRQI